MRVNRSVMVRLVVSIASGLVVLSGQTLERFEIRKPAASPTGKLVAYVDDREVNLSADAIRAWLGWHPEILIFTERTSDGREHLRAFNAITGGRTTITTERAVIHDITVARLDDGNYTLVLFLRESSEGTPSVALADPKNGVFRRVPNATVAAIVNDTVTLNMLGKVDEGRTAELPPSRTEVISLRPTPRSAQSPPSP